MKQQDLMTYDAKARELVGEMTLDEKLGMIAATLRPYDAITLSGMFLPGNWGGYNYRPWKTRAVKRLGVPAVGFCDGPRGVVSGTSTCFPVTMARGATFDKELEERVGKVIGAEVRANGGNFFGGVCMNLPYHPGWGRSQEVYGEDSMHMGKMAVALTNGVQSQNVVACLKHYAFNSMENMRFKVNVTADKRTEQEIYLRHFRQAVEEAGAGSVMAAYNLYRGDQCCESKYLIQDVLKDRYGFNGFVITDFFFGLHDAEKGFHSGLDIEYPFPYRWNKPALKRLLKKGKISMEELDAKCVAIARTLLFFQEREDPQKYPKKILQSKEHIALAKEVADKALTLLKNEAVLPLDKKTKKVVLAGELADYCNIGDHGSSWIMRANADTVYEAACEAFGKRNVTLVPTAELNKHKKDLEQADAVIAVVGLKHDDEGENLSEATSIGGDRKQGIGLHEEEVELLQGLAAYKAKTTAVLIGGNTLLLDPWYDCVGAILQAYYPGMRGGHAIVDVLTGKTNPSGKSPFVIPYKEEDLPKIDWDATEWHYEYYHGYRKLDKENVAPRVPYGYGLSYTTFKLSGAKKVHECNKCVKFEVTVKNTGKVYGGEVVQLYVGSNGSNVDRPVRSLMDFEKVYLKPGEKKTVTLVVKKKDLAYFDEAKDDFVIEDIAYTAYIGTDEQSCVDTAIKF
ncbi:MAG: glycoside hydrolase family 3 C-terminal domain-containing protein [Clostridia bacterium]|nr:glycoside hydrolase family 3 C-terminal domain-containing protein [Clostridia bacterium]